MRPCGYTESYASWAIHSPVDDYRRGREWRPGYLHGFFQDSEEATPVAVVEDALTGQILELWPRLVNVFPIRPLLAPRSGALPQPGQAVSPLRGLSTLVTLAPERPRHWYSALIARWFPVWVSARRCRRIARAAQRRVYGE